MTEHTLAGAHVAVTRALPAARNTAAALRERGATAILSPVLVVRARPLPVDVIRDVQAIVVSSRNGARRLAELDIDRNFPVYAVGDATAEMARRCGMRQVTSAQGDGAALAATLAAGVDPADGALLHLRGRDVAGALSERAREAGFEWRDIIAYGADYADRLSEDLVAALRDERLDAVLFHSQRGAAAFVELAERFDLSAGCRRVAAIAMSEAARAPAAALPFRVRVAASAPNEQALFSRLEEVWQASAP